jgi:lipopolysaccharide transport system ATP-binding protein
MTDVALELQGIFKKFRRGERHDSLRDLLPALARRAVRGVTGAASLKPEEFWALHDVSFRVAKGEAVGIMGHNGAGKSTMLKLLSGILQPTAGEMTVRGRLSALIEVGAGFHQDLTGRENVYLNGVILGMTRAEVRRKFDEIVDFSGLADFIDTPVKRYSSGMYARLGFSVAAHLEPDLLIVDEVLSVGDFVFQQKSIEKMRSVRRSGATVIFVSHNLRAMADLCERALLLNKGRVVADGPTSQVIHTYMEQARQARKLTGSEPVYIESVTVSGAHGPRFDFEAGERVTVAVRVKAHSGAAQVACVIYLLDENHYNVFEISSDRLQGGSRDYAAGEEHTYRFELDLHLAAGNFQLGALLFRHDIKRTYDQIEPVATLLVSTPVGIRGLANLYPRLVSSD